jgi:hypothetical protein
MQTTGSLVHFGIQCAVQEQLAERLKTLLRTRTAWDLKPDIRVEIRSLGTVHSIPNIQTCIRKSQGLTVSFAEDSAEILRWLTQTLGLILNGRNPPYRRVIIIKPQRQI